MASVDGASVRSLDLKFTYLGSQFYNMKDKCLHHLGQKMITHDGLQHPGGPQFCFVCKKTLDEILQGAKNEERLAVLIQVADLLDEFNQMSPDCCQFQVNIPNGSKFASRLLALRGTEESGD